MLDAAEYQKMKDDRMVNEAMAEVDTRIDKAVLEFRAADGVTHDAKRNLHAHMERPRAVQQIIEEIRAQNFGYIESEREWEGSFGKYDGSNDDAYLSYVLDFAGEDYADESTGSTEWNAYVQRFGQVLLLTDDRGFVFADIYESDRLAKQKFNEIDREYCEWDQESDGGW